LIVVSSSSFVLRLEDLSSSLFINRREKKRAREGEKTGLLVQVGHNIITQY
jgi:hypothetical protein